MRGSVKALFRFLLLGFKPTFSLSSLPLSYISLHVSITSVWKTLASIFDSLSLVFLSPSYLTKRFEYHLDKLFCVAIIVILHFAVRKNFGFINSSISNSYEDDVNMYSIGNVIMSWSNKGCKILCLTLFPIKFITLSWHMIFGINSTHDFLKFMAIESINCEKSMIIHDLVPLYDYFT